MITWYKKPFGELTVDELYEIMKLRNEVFVVEQTCIYQDLDDKDKKSILIFAMDDGKCIATLRVIPAGVSYDVPSIGRVVVKQEYRHKGLSQKMMLDGIETAKEVFHAKEIRLSGQAYVRKFYEDLGFKAITDIYLEDGIEHYGFLYTV